MSATRFPTLESDALALLGDDEPRALTERFAGLARESGSADERAAADYIVARLRAFGLEPRVHEPSLFLSIPRASSIKVAPRDGRPVEADSRPAAFSRSTGGDAITGEVAYVQGEYSSTAGTFLDTPESALVAAADDLVCGRIVVTEGFPVPGAVHAYERRGAIAQIYVQPGDAIHEFTCTTIWGTPTHESIATRPRTPVVSIARASGEKLIAAARGGARATVRTTLDEGWFACPLITVDIHGAVDPEEFLLVHGHYDSWYAGVGDNATGSGALVELARVLHRVRADLRRTVRLAWWPAQLAGAHAGSAWYADAFADEIDEWCIAHVNVQSPGCTGATSYDEVVWMAEAAELCVDAIADAVGASAKGGRPPRAGDYSFNQIGVTGCYLQLSSIPSAERRARGDYAVGGAGGNLAWHTPEDNLAVADFTVLRRDLQIYLTTILRIVNAPLHPFDHTAAVLEIGAAVQRYQLAAGNEADLRGVSEDLKRLRRELAAWRSDAETAVGRDMRNHELRRRVNATIRRIARILVPVSYARGERFDHDPAVKFSAVPRLEAALHIGTAQPAMRPFLQAALIRERNRIRAAVRDVLQLVASPGRY